MARTANMRHPGGPGFSSAISPGVARRQLKMSIALMALLAATVGFLAMAAGGGERSAAPRTIRFSVQQPQPAAARTQAASREAAALAPASGTPARL